MKRDRLLYLITFTLVIWLIILSVYNNQPKLSENKDIVNQYTVSGFSTDFTKIVEDKDSSVVTISADGKTSSGFIYSQDDNYTYILTSYHGVADAFTINVIFPSSFSTTGKIIGKNIYTDIAVLQIEIPFDVQPLVMGDSCMLNAGEYVIGIGTPVSIEYANSVELAMISSLRTIENSIISNETPISYYLDVVQLSSDLLSGYSGCPILNMNGEVVGIVTMSINPNFNFAITANEAQIITDKIIANQECIKHQFGIKGTYLIDMQKYEKASLNIGLDILNGLYVDKINETSALYSLGLRKGDVITKINDIEICTLNDYLKVAYSSSDLYTFSICRGQETFDILLNIDA